MEKPRPRSTRLLRFHGGTGDGTGGVAVTIKLTTISGLSSLASASVGAPFIWLRAFPFGLGKMLPFSQARSQRPSLGAPMAACRW